MSRKRGSVAVVGAAESDLGLVAPEMSPTDLMVQATLRALDDCGLKVTDIDCVFASHSQSRMAVLQLCEYLRINPRYYDSTIVGGSSFMAHLAHAQTAIENGDAEVAVAARKWALMNSVAWEKELLTIEQVLNARMVSYPFTVRDCCLVTDGGGAIVITSAARAKSLKKKAAYMLGVGESIGHATISNMPNLTVTAAAESGRQAFKMAGLKPADVKMLSLYDAFTITPILFLEDLGFCPKGEGGRFVSNGAIAPGGKLAVNTSGGGLSYCHPGMYGLLVLIEAVRQVRGECGQRQVKDCNVSLAHGNGGVLSSECTVILGSEATL